MAGTTVADFARSLEGPQLAGEPEWSLEDWFDWPPDVFALTSAILARTGGYRRVLSRYPHVDQTQQTWLERQAGEWLSYVQRRLVSPPPPSEGDAEAEALPDSIGGVIDRFQTLAGRVTLERLRLAPMEAGPNVDADWLLRDLLFFHALSDEACAGFGFHSRFQPEHAVAACFANLLLTARGSLATLPKHSGVVLPKLRTPQGGLTVRSLSHHLTYHVTEVEVMWRSLPWPNVQENKLNLLVVPWPFEIRAESFHPRHDELASARIFRFDRRADSERFIRRVVDLVARVEKENRQLHLLVFPELALSRSEFTRLLTSLNRSSIENLPVVVSGVRNRWSPDEGRGTGEERETDLNEVRIAAFFANRWYPLSQRKHHRWRLDRDQVRQYQLQGRMSTARDWFEQTPMGQRRLTVLAPSGWLALAPLICEDLAQIEPVSPVIRGIGPTLVLALLLDGPQLPQRWSGRYASVLADDPGSAVLTLSSMGMTKRARPVGMTLEKEELERNARIVGLWKDPLGGLEQIAVEDESDSVLITISARWTEEYTADGRTDHCSAAAFQLDGVVAYRGGFEDPPSQAAGGRTDPGDAAEDGGESPPGADPATEESSTGLLADWGDIRELTAGTFVLNSVLSSWGKEIDLMSAWLLAREAEGCASPRLTRARHDLRAILLDPSVDGIRASHGARWNGRPRTGAPGDDDGSSVEPSTAGGQLEKAVEEMTRILSPFDGPPSDSNEKGSVEETRFYIEHLVDEATAALGKGSGGEVGFTGADRTTMAVHLGTLGLVHGRLERLRRRLPRPHATGSSDRATLPSDIAARLLRRIERTLHDVGRRKSDS